MFMLQVYHEIHFNIETGMNLCSVSDSAATLTQKENLYL